MRQLHGHPVLVAETFVDPSRFRHLLPGLQLAFVGHDPRLPASARRHAAGPITVNPRRSSSIRLHANNWSRLEDAPDWSSQGESQPLSDDRLRSLFECLVESRSSASPGAGASRPPCWRWRWRPAWLRRRDRLCRVRFPPHPEAVGRPCGPTTASKTEPLHAPTTTTFHTVLARLPPDTLDWVLRQWAAQMSRDRAPVAVDGKQVRGASRHNPRDRTLLEPPSNMARAWSWARKRSGTRATRSPPCAPWWASSRISPAAPSAWMRSTCKPTPAPLVQQGPGPLPGHGREEKSGSRTSAPSKARVRPPNAKPSTRPTGASNQRADSLDLTGQQWDGSDLPHRRQGIQRQRTHVKTGATSSEVTYGPRCPPQRPTPNA